MKLPAIFGLWVLSLVSCQYRGVHPKGPIESEARTTTGFSGVDIRLPAVVTITEAPECGLELVGPENIRDAVQTPVRNDVLVLKFSRRVWMETGSAPLRINVRMPGLRVLLADAAAEVSVKAGRQEKAVTIQLDGSSRVVVENLGAQQLTASVDGASSLRLTGGAVERAHYAVDGASELQAQVPCRQVSVNLDGAGEAFVAAFDQLDADLDGSSTLRYKGAPVQVRTRVDGASTVVRVP